MFTRFDATKSTKGASKLRRDLINAEIANLRDLLPLPLSTRQRLSQLQLMALVCVYVRKANYFQQVFKRYDMRMHHCMPSNMGFSKALSGFLMMMTQHGKLLYISDNAAEYLGHSMEDLLIHGDSMYDMIDKQDQQTVQNELVKNMPNHGDDERLFLCRMNVSRNARRQMRFGDQKVILIRGHYHAYLPLSSRNEPVFLATCTPIAMPETRECVVQGATNVFTAIHSMDMKFMHIDRNGEFHLGYSRSELHGISWYQLLHWDYAREGQCKHRLITQSEQDRSCILLIRLQRKSGGWVWIHCVLQVKDNMENSQQPIIVSTNQLLSDKEAQVLRDNSWLYSYYSVQTKLQYGISYDTGVQPPPPPKPPMAPPDYFPKLELMTSYHDDQHYHHNVLSTNSYQASPLLNQSTSSSSSHFYYQLPAAGPSSHNVQQPQNWHLRRATDPEPVDYSVHSASQEETPDRSPFYKKENRRPTIPSSELSPSSPSSSDIAPDTVDRSDGEGLLLSATTSSSSLGRSRALVKAASTVVDPADFMDQWNPSPPWSDTTMQKVPDILHQDLSPHMTSTPPTPTAGLPLPGHTYPSFSFDWTAEQYVPSGAPAIPATTRAAASLSALLEEDIYSHGLPSFTWPTEHRLIPLQPPPRGSPFIVKVESEAYLHHRDSQDPGNIS